MLHTKEDLHYMLKNEMRTRRMPGYVNQFNKTGSIFIEHSAGKFRCVVTNASTQKVTKTRWNKDIKVVIVKAIDIAQQIQNEAADREFAINPTGL
jgi:hypothetical protein